MYTGACGAFTEVACDDHDDPLGSYLHTDVSAATDYWIEVARAPGAVGAIRVVVYFDPDSPICPHDAGDFAIEKTSLTLGSPPGHDTRVTLGARPGLRAAVPDVATTGVQLLVETADGYDYVPIVEWSARRLPSHGRAGHRVRAERRVGRLRQRRELSLSQRLERVAAGLRRRLRQRPHGRAGETSAE